jgi:TetR/AcrR family transcriptional repressor of nem operon
MARQTNRDKILSEGMRVVLARFGGASVRDIVQAAGVPQGSFTNHFASKDAFGLELLAIYAINIRAVMQRTLRNEFLHPLQGLKEFIDANKTRLVDEGIQHGCMSGNFSAETGDFHGAMRTSLLAIFTEVRQSVAFCLRRAVRHGALPQDTASDVVAGFIVSGLQGAILLSKVERTLVPIDQFETVLYWTVLRHPELMGATSSTTASA